MTPLRRLEEELSTPLVSDRYVNVRHPLSTVKLWAPVPRPNSIRDFLVFEEHLINCTHAFLKKRFPIAALINSAYRRLTGKPLMGPPKVWYEIPIYYKGNADTVIGPEETIITPRYTRELDYELELGVYLWKTGKDIDVTRANEYIAGYTIFNDVSARDIQFREMAGRLGPTKGKDFDTGNVMGPYLVTKDEIKDPYSLDMRAYVNGILWSSGNSRAMRFTFEQMIAYVSQSETLHAGDFLGSGTVGTGCGLELGRSLNGGDRVALEIDGLGTLSNPIGS